MAEVADGVAVAVADHQSSVTVWRVALAGSELAATECLRIPPTGEGDLRKVAWVDAERGFLAVVRSSLVEMYHMAPGSSQVALLYKNPLPLAASAAVATVAFSARTAPEHGLSDAGLSDGRNLVAVADTAGKVSVFRLTDPRSSRAFDAPVHAFVPHRGQPITGLLFCTAAPVAVPSGPSTSCEHPLLLSASANNTFVCLCRLLFDFVHFVGSCFFCFAQETGTA